MTGDPVVVCVYQHRGSWVVMVPALNLLGTTTNGDEVESTARDLIAEAMNVGRDSFAVDLVREGDGRAEARAIMDGRLR